MKNYVVIYISTALATLLVFAYFFILPTHFELVNPVEKANAQETPAERAHEEENKTNNVQNDEVLEVYQNNQLISVYCHKI